MLKNLSIFILIFVLCLMSSENNYCAFERINGGARAEALAGAFTACADDYNSIFYNPAGLTILKNKEGAFFYSIPYNLKELGTKCFAFVLPYKHSGIGIVLQQMGTELYNESQFVFSSGVKIYKDFSIGVSSKLLNLSIKGYGSKSILAIDTGVLYAFKDDLKFGAFFNNINNPGIGSPKEKISKLFSVGISKKLISGLTLNLDLSRYNKYPVIIRFGGEMNFNEQFFLRLGINDNPTNFSGGFGVNLKKITLNYSASNHIILGMTNQFSIILKIR